MRARASLSLVLLASATASCMHVKGIVLQERGERPMRSAVLSVGRPDGIGVFDAHHVDEWGTFDFYIFPTDEVNLYMYDSAGNPALTIQRIDRTQISDRMRLHLSPAPKNVDPGMDMRVPGPGVNF